MGSSTPPHTTPQQPGKAAQNPTLLKIWAIAMPILAMIGVPSAIIAVWKDFFFQHPFWAVSLFVFCIIISCIISLIIFIDKGYQKESSKPFDDITERVLSWTGTHVYTIFSHPLTRYHRAIYSKYQTLNALRLTENLEQTLEFLKIFVHPRIRQNIEFDDVSSSPHAVLNTRSRDDEHTIEYFLTQPAFAENNFVILGSPGSGKSALLQYIALTLVNTDDKTNNTDVPPRKKYPIPILLHLYDFLEEDKHTRQYRFTIAHQTIAEALYNSNQKNLYLSFVPMPRWLDYHLLCGHCLVMLDGLDEVIGDTIRPQVLDWIRGQMTRYNASRFILTSRRQNYQGRTNLNLIVRLEILSFEEEQIVKFVGNMFACSANVPKTRSNPQACLERLRENEKIWELVHNPLLLSVSVSLHIFTSSALPKNRAEFYKQICDDLLRDPQSKTGNLLKYTKDQLEEGLRLLAYTLMQPPQTNNIDIHDPRLTIVQEHIQKVNPQATLAQFLKTTYNLGLLEQLHRDDTIYSLFHSTVREYLTATYLHETNNDQELIDKLDQPEWKEIILLYCAQSDASDIIHACLQKQELDLALACEKEARNIKESVRAKLDQLRASITTETDPVRRKIIATSRLEQLLDLMSLLDKNCYITTRYIACVEYQLFLDQYYAQKQFYQPDHWSTSSLPFDQSAHPLLGVRSSDVLVFCQSLTEADRDGWRYRPPTAEECTRIDHRMLPPLTGCFDDQGYFHWVSSHGFDLPNIAQQVHDLFQQDCQSAPTRQIPAVLVPAHKNALALNDFLAPMADATFMAEWETKMVDAFRHVQEHALDLSRFARLPEFAGIIHNPQHIQDSEFMPVQQLAHALEQAVASVLSREHNTNPAMQAELATLLWSVRYFAWTITRMLLYWRRQISSAGLSRQRRSDQRQLQAREAYRQQLDLYLAQYFDLCIAFALLELRITNKIPAWEGVLLVKEFATPVPSTRSTP